MAYRGRKPGAGRCFRMDRKREEMSEQGVPDYDPQAAALHTPRHATHLHPTAVGRA